LAQVSECERHFGDFGAFIREFCDEFYIEQEAHVRATMLEVEPPLGSDEKRNAYFGAVAEHLARRYFLPIPKWTDHSARFLRRAWFPGGLESLKATLLRESPPAFRRRMIFVGGDPLYRPRRDKQALG
jgi:hypothetical protein